MEDEEQQDMASLLESTSLLSYSGADTAPQHLLSKLQEAFLSERHGGVKIPWEELAQRRIQLGDIVNGLSSIMEQGMGSGVTAGRVYLALLLAQDSPIYSLFSPLAFQTLFRCIRCSCKPIVKPPNDEAGPSNYQGKKLKKKGKRARELHQEHEHDANMEIEDESVCRASFKDIVALIKEMAMVIKVLSFKDHQESLKGLVELLIELPQLFLEFQGHEGLDDTAFRGAKSRRGCSNNAPSLSQSVVPILFSMFRSLLKSNHGDSQSTAIMILKLFTPSILLTHGTASPQHRYQIRTACLNFIINDMLKGEDNHAIRMAVLALSRYMCLKAPEKSDGRTHAVEALLEFVRHFNANELSLFSKFVAKLARGKPKHRLLAVDIALVFLENLPDPLGLQRDVHEDEQSRCMKDNVYPRHEEAECVDPIDTEDKMDEAEPSKATNMPENLWWGISCLETLLQRCSDKIPAIRARALSNLAQAIDFLSKEIRPRIYLQQLLGAESSSMPPREQRGTPELLSTPFQGIPVMGVETPSTGSGNTPTLLSPGAHQGNLGSLLRKRCQDDKAAVRKAALTLITKSAILMGRSPDEESLQAMGVACSDAMVSIRKAALVALSEVTKRFSRDNAVLTEWLQSALPLILDNETSIREEVLGFFQEIVLDPIVAISSRQISNTDIKLFLLQKSEENVISPAVLNFLRGMSDVNVASVVKRICACLGKKKALRATIALALQSLVTASADILKKRSYELSEVEIVVQGAWLLLSEISEYVPKAIGWSFLRSHWQLLDKRKSRRANNNEHTPVPFSSCSKHEYNESVAWASSRVYLLQTISNVAVELPPDTAADLADELLKHVEAFDMHPAEVGAHVTALNTLCRRKAATLEEAEELVHVWVKRLVDKAEEIIELYLHNIQETQDTSFLTPKASSKKRSGKKAMEVEDASSQIVAAIFTVGAIVLVCPSAKLGRIIDFLQQMVSPRNGSITKPLESAVYAQTWVTLGKLCLAKDKLAKRFIPLFIQELESTESAAVRNNIMVAMTDYCIRYTALIDGYIPKLTKSLRDKCEIVRRQAFILLARLLQRDYVKWRGILFHRFLLALVDDSTKISQMASFLFGTILKTKAPLLAYNSFVEAIFVLNDYCAHAGGSSALQVSENERQLFSLRGSNSDVAEKRMHIYKALLNQMAPEHLLATSAKLCAEIVAGAVDGLLDLNDPQGQCVLEDALKVLACKELRLNNASNRGLGAGGDGLEEEDPGSTGGAFAAVKGRVVTQLAKRNLIQNAIPIFIELKRLLESKSSPLLGMLMECIRVMLKDYKNEIEEILVADRQLQKEIMYDMQKHEASKARSKVEAVMEKSRDDTNKASSSGVQANEAERPANSSFVNEEMNAYIPPNRQHTSSKDDDLSKQPLPVSVMKTKTKTKMKMKMKGKALATSATTPSKERSLISPRVTWLDQTPKTNTGALPRNGRPSLVKSRFESMVPAALPVIGKSIARAVGDATAAATVATVLQEVASGKSTPLGSMSLPRLRSDVSSLTHQLQQDCDLGPGDGNEVIATVRRRQSFSLADE